MRSGSGSHAEDRRIERFVVVSGCSGGGKSTLLAALGAQGFAVVPEPGRRIVEEEMRGSGAALPWCDLAAFARRAIELSLADRAEAAGQEGWVFFDRGLVDAAVALDHATGEEIASGLAATHRYHRTVFLTPPWPDIYVRDAERPHGFAEAIDEYERLEAAYSRFGYETVILPKRPVEERLGFVLARLGSS
jgi:predicted ATPase